MTVRADSSELRRQMTAEDKEILRRLARSVHWWDHGETVAAEWLLRPLFAPGAVTMVTGVPKDAGKTTFLLHAANALVRGESFLDEPGRDPRGVVYVSEETKTIRRAADRVGLPRSDRFSLIDRTMVLGIPWDRLVGILAAHTVEFGAGLIVIDTFAHFAQLTEGQEQDAAVMGARMRAAQALADQTQVAVAVVVHERKSGGGKPTTRARGSNASVAAVDQVVRIAPLRGRSTARRVNVIGRLTDEQSLLVELTSKGYVLIKGGEVDDDPVLRPKGARNRRTSELKLAACQATGIFDPLPTLKLTPSFSVQLG